MGCLSRFVSLPRLSASLEVGLGYVNNCLPRKLRDTFLAEEGYIFRSRFLSTQRSPSLVDFLDLTLPHTWYPFARTKKRRVVMHVGPTNSGKTYMALESLRLSASGVYCGPLRLLAWEIAERLNKANVLCSLITGQEKREVTGAKHQAMTVEMADVTRHFECGVIDEIQMIACRDRGFSFTRALLGLAVDELHLCGDPAAVSIVDQILATTGDTFEVKQYERLSPLVPQTRALGSYSHVRKGDCVVAFSRRDIYSIKKEIESSCKHNCSVVYGSLPPETRTKQAALFNDVASGSDILVASDAVGMGLNLNIRRIIFSTLEKFDGTSMRALTVAEIKQIAGRAGRYGSKFPEGAVTCLDKEDLPLLHHSLATLTCPLEAAGLFPSFDLLALYSASHPNMTFSAVLEKFVAKARMSPQFFMRHCESMLIIADMLEKLPLSLEDRFLFCICPVDTDDHMAMGALLQFATEFSRQEMVTLKKVITPATIRVPRTQTALQQLESLHKVLELYVWLSLRMEDAFVDQEAALSQKELCGMLIEQGLQLVGRAKPKRKVHNKRELKLMSLKGIASNWTSEREEVEKDDSSHLFQDKDELCAEKGHKSIAESELWMPKWTR
ncbi:hypothetical protein BDL97_13G049000 [Sphagnum fallax]|nr:hypothetical protein BDL97_13G049000 [Sphagnum fallax]